MFTENKITEFKQAIRKLADRPQMSAQALKEYFDGSAEELRVALNALIDALSGFAAHTISDVQYTAADGKLTFITASGEEVCIDLPLELLVESGHYDAATKNIVLVLANGDELNIPVGDLVGEPIDTYHADGQTLVCEDNTFSVKDGVFATARQTAEDIASAKNTVLAESKAYTDALQEKAAEDIANAKNTALAESKAYTDALQEKTAEDIADAKAYTDALLADVNTNAFELIASGKTKGDVTSVYVSKDNDGRAFELCDRIYIYIYCPQHSEDSAIAYDFNGGLVHRTVARAVCSVSKMRVNFQGVYTGKIWDCYSVVGNARDAAVYANTVYDGNGNMEEHDAIINEITIRTANSFNTLPTGFVYEIYGRRVKK